GLPSGRCSITASPYDSVFPSLIATVGQRIFEAPTGSTWTETRTNRAIQGRIPFVAVNKRSGGTGKFDLWFGDTLLHRVACDANVIGNKCGQSLNCCIEGPDDG